MFVIKMIALPNLKTNNFYPNYYVLKKPIYTKKIAQLIKILIFY